MAIPVQPPNQPVTLQSLQTKYGFHLANKWEDMRKGYLESSDCLTVAELERLKFYRYLDDRDLERPDREGLLTDPAD